MPLEFVGRRSSVKSIRKQTIQTHPNWAGLNSFAQLYHFICLLFLIYPAVTFCKLIDALSV